MSNGNVALVQSLYGAFGRGEIGAIADAMTADAEWTVTGRRSDFPLLGTWTGPDGVRRFFAQIDETLEFSEFVPRDFFAGDDKVFVIGRYAATIRRTGRTVSSCWIHVFTLRNGKVGGFREFTDTAQFAEAWRG
jgi:ketosteroid isomerase-like protein